MSAELPHLASTPSRFDTLLYVLHRGLQFLHHGLSLMSYRLVAQPVMPEPPGGVRARGGTVVVRQALAGDPILSQVDRPKPELERRFASPGVCFVAHKGASLIGYLWVVFGSYQEPDDRCTVLPAPRGEAVWDLDVYVEPAERLGSTFARLWGFAQAYLHGRRVRWTLSRISAYNARSLASHARLGAVELGRLYFLRLFGLQLFLGNVAPYVHVSLGASPGPEIVVRAPSAPGNDPEP